MGCRKLAYSQTEESPFLTVTKSYRDEKSSASLFVYGARYYSAWTCRFINVDPLAGKFPHLSPYNYAGNKPITHKDLYGLQGTGDTPVKEQVQKKVDQVTQTVTEGLQQAKQKAGETIDQVKKGTQELKQDKEKQVENLAIDNMKSYADSLHPGVSKLNEEQKQELFKTDTKATIAILLDEFASGTGSSDGKREFTDQHQIVKDLAKMDITEKAVDAFYQKNEGKEMGQLEKTSYIHSMSPNAKISEGFNLDDFFIEHGKIGIEALKGEDPLRVFLGSMTYSLKPDGNNIDITVSDSKSRYSLFFHASGVTNIAKSVERKEGQSNPPLSTTRQGYNFSVPIDADRLKTWTQKAGDMFNNTIDYFRKW